MDWINVDKKLPTEIGMYLCYVRELNDLGVSRYMWVCSFSPSDKSWRSELRYISVTHWMPLPEPPKEQTNDRKS